MPTIESPSRPFLSAVILAAGAASRMGRPKQLLPLGDRCLLQYVVDETLASGLDEVILVLGHRAEEIRGAIHLPEGARLQVVLNEDYQLGQSSSLRLGLRSTDARAAAAAIILGDQPKITGELINQVAAAFCAGPSPLARPVYVTADGRRVPGHPVFLARRVWPEVEKLRGDQGARVLLSNQPDWLLEVPVHSEPPVDIDTWEDYQRAVDDASGSQRERAREAGKGEQGMDAIRIMPCLDMKDGRVVKGVHFVDLREAGDPVENASFYQAEGADELAMLDIAATLENRKTRLQWVKAVSSVIKIPLTVGGGIGSLDDIRLVLEAGANKVSMNSAAVNNPDLIKMAADSFGSETITVAVDGRRNKDMPSGFEVVIAGGTKPVGKDAVAWAKTCQDLGAGVILPTSMDGDGTQTGYDLEFTKAISDAVSLPVVASGGAGTLEHFYQAAVQGGAHVLLAASVFHYRILSIGDVKRHLRAKGLQVAGT